MAIDTAGNLIKKENRYTSAMNQSVTIIFLNGSASGHRRNGLGFFFIELGFNFLPGIVNFTFDKYQ